MKSVVEDGGLKLPTPQAAASLDTATKLFQWMNDEQNEDLVKMFAKKLIDCIRSCLPTGDRSCLPTGDTESMSTKIRREKMWKSERKRAVW